MTHASLMAELAAAFPRQPIKRDTLRIYLRELADIELAALAAAVAKLIGTEEFLPSIARIRETVAEMTLELPSDAQALAQVESRIAWARRGVEGDRPHVHPLVKEALELVGGFSALRQTDVPSVIRGQFLALYRDLRRSAILGVQVRAELQPGAARRQLTSGA